ncbi:MAG: hypothetical protein ACOH2V_00395 [Candidatus Saccharimonadaceae bacterium]
MKKMTMFSILVMMSMFTACSDCSRSGRKLEEKKQEAVVPTERDSTGCRIAFSFAELRALVNVNKFKASQGTLTGLVPPYINKVYILDPEKKYYVQLKY